MVKRGHEIRQFDPGMFGQSPAKAAMRLAPAVLICLLLMGGTARAAILTYQFSFDDVAGLGPVSGTVSFVEPVVSLPVPSQAIVLSGVDFEFDPGVALAPGPVTGTVPGFLVDQFPNPTTLFAYQTTFTDDTTFSLIFFVELDGDVYNDRASFTYFVPQPVVGAAGTASRVETAPEPATLWLLGAALSAAAVRYRKRLR